jgi:hypothetical protein
MKIIPPGMPFVQALRLGYVGEIRMPAYLAWLRELPCHTCHIEPGGTASHPNFFKTQKIIGVLASGNGFTAPSQAEFLFQTPMPSGTENHIARGKRDMQTIQAEKPRVNYAQFIAAQPKYQPVPSPP